MSEVAIFSFGSVLFVMTTWATFSFGMRRVHELQAEDMADSGRISEGRTDAFTEIHLSSPYDNDRHCRVMMGRSIR